MIILIALIVWGYLELSLMLMMADKFGWLSTLALTVVSGIAGVAIARAQGLSVLLSVRRELSEGQLPVRSMISGMLLLFAGVLLLLPGVITDVVGLLLLIPPLRHAAAIGLISWWRRQLRRGGIQVRIFGSGQSKTHDPMVVEGRVIKDRERVEDTRDSNAH